MACGGGGGGDAGWRSEEKCVSVLVVCPPPPLVRNASTPWAPPSQLWPLCPPWRPCRLRWAAAWAGGGSPKHQQGRASQAYHQAGLPHPSCSSTSAASSPAGCPAALTLHPPAACRPGPPARRPGPPTPTGGSPTRRQPWAAAAAGSTGRRPGRVPTRTWRAGTTTCLAAAAGRLDPRRMQQRELVGVVGWYGPQLPQPSASVLTTQAGVEQATHLTTAAAGAAAEPTVRVAVLERAWARRRCGHPPRLCLLQPLARDGGPPSGMLRQAQAAAQLPAVHSCGLSRRSSARREWWGATCAWWQRPGRAQPCFGGACALPRGWQSVLASPGQRYGEGPQGQEAQALAQA